MSAPRSYEVEKVAAISIPAEDQRGPQSGPHILPLGGKILACPNEYFNSSTSLLNPKPPKPPIHKPDKMAIVRLGVASGIITGIKIDTAFYTGNSAPEISGEGVFAPNDEEE
ncbi:Allantoicase [Pseudogymnoascus australis]